VNQLTFTFDENPDNLPERFRKFLEYHAANPGVWTMFLRYARDARKAGRDRMGARMIFERIRWYVVIETTGGDFKISNNHFPYYARLAMARHAELAGLFQTIDAKFDTTVEELVRRAR